MEAAVQMQAPQQVQAAVQSSSYYRTADGVGTGFVKTSGAGSGAESDEGSFEAMLSGMLGTNGSDSQAQLTIMEQLKDEMEENGTDAAMQMMAELLLAQPTLLAQMDPSMLMQQISGMGGGQSDMSALTGMLTGQDQTALLAAMQNLTPQELAQLKNDPQAFAKGLLEQAGISVEVIQSGLANAEASQDTLLGQAGFQRALYQVRQAQGATGEGEKKFSDLEAVLGVQKNTQTTPNEAAVSGVLAPQLAQTAAGQVEQLSDSEMLDLQAILAQLKTGITENVQKGANDFVIKLKPEGLGEITVRMSEQAGKISMEINASSQYTQRLLSNEIGSLRQVMEPYHVVVNTAQASADSTSFDMEQQMRQGFAQQQQQSGQQSHGNYYAAQDDVIETQEPSYFGIAPSSDLDTYI